MTTFFLIALLGCAVGVGFVEVTSIHRLAVRLPRLWRPACVLLNLACLAAGAYAFQQRCLPLVSGSVLDSLPLFAQVRTLFGFAWHTLPVLAGMISGIYYLRLALTPDRARRAPVDALS